MRTRRAPRLVAAVLAAAILHASLPAGAQSANQEAPSGAPAPSSPPPDVVRLKNGGFLRGTILESIPNDHVDIQLPNGQTRRIEWGEVAYAGPANGAPPGTSAPPPVAPAAPGTPASDEVPIQFEADGAEELRLHARVGQSEFTGVGWSGRGAVAISGQSREYASLCVAPCRTRMPLGTHRLALSTLGGKTIEASDSVRIDGPSTVHGHYESYTGTRVAGWLVFSGGLLAGLVIMATAYKKTQDCSVGPDYCFPKTEVDGTQVGVGIGVMTVGLVVGLIMALKHDAVSFTVSPLSAAAPGLGRQPLWAGAPQGLALTAHF